MPFTDAFLRLPLPAGRGISAVFFGPFFSCKNTTKENCWWRRRGGGGGVVNFSLNSRELSRPDKEGDIFTAPHPPFWAWYHTCVGFYSLYILKKTTRLNHAVSPRGGGVEGSSHLFTMCGAPICKHVALDDMAVCQQLHGTCNQVAPRGSAGVMKSTGE